MALTVILEKAGSHINSMFRLGLDLRRGDGPEVRCLIVICRAHLLRIADRAEDDALQLLRVGTVPLRVVDPEPRCVGDDNADGLLVELGAGCLVGRLHGLL